MIKSIWHVFTLTERRWLVLLVFILLANCLLELVGLALVIPYVNLMLSEQYLTDYLEIFAPLGWMLSLTDNYRFDVTIWFMGFYLLKNTLLGFIAFFMHTIQKQLHANVVQRMYRAAISQSYAEYIKKNTSDVIRTITYDAIKFGEAVLSHSGILFTEFFLFVGVLVILAVQQIEVVLVIVFITLLLAIVFMLLKKRLVVWGGILQQCEARVIQDLQEGLGGFKDIQVLGVIGYFQSQFDRNVDLRSRIKRNRDFTVLMPRFVIEILIMFSMASVLFWMSRAGGLEKNLASIAFLAVVVVRMLPMSNRIMNSISAIRSDLPSIKVVSSNLKNHSSREVKKPTRLSEKKLIRVKFQSLQIEGLTFKYEGGQPLLRGISAEVKRGQVVGIVGSSGAGKTTLVDIILGLLTPVSGHILFNGDVDLQDDMRGWQTKVGYVQQNIFLLDGSISENIAYGVAADAVDAKKVEQAARLAKLSEWISSLPDGFETGVGERGIGISGGQRQRIGIARALYHNPEILLLDEATSALDNQTEKSLMEDVYSMKRERTIILIAHRMDTIRKCDNIIVLDQGMIAGVGDYDTLYKQNTVFKAITAQSPD